MSCARKSFDVEVLCVRGNDQKKKKYLKGRIEDTKKSLKLDQVYCA